MAGEEVSGVVVKGWFNPAFLHYPTQHVCLQKSAKLEKGLQTEI